MKLEDDHYCFGCGSENASGLKLGFNKPAAIGKKLIFSAKIVSENKKMIMLAGACEDEDGKKIALSSSKCVKV